MWSTRRELFWEDQENFDPGEFFGSVLKQYYLDAAFIPAEVHVPADFEDRALLEDWLSARRGRRVEIRTPQRGSKREMMDLVHRNARLVFLQRFRAATLSPAALSREIEEALDLESRLAASSASTFPTCRAATSWRPWWSGRTAG